MAVTSFGKKVACDMTVTNPTHPVRAAVVHHCVADDQRQSHPAWSLVAPKAEMVRPRTDAGAKKTYPIIRHRPVRRPPNILPAISLTQRQQKRGVTPPGGQCSCYQFVGQGAGLWIAYGPTGLSSNHDLAKGLLAAAFSTQRCPATRQGRRQNFLRAS
jgi:hypothetical protein